MLWLYCNLNKGLNLDEVWKGLFFWVEDQRRYSLSKHQIEFSSAMRDD